MRLERPVESAAYSGLLGIVLGGIYRVRAPGSADMTAGHQLNP